MESRRSAASSAPSAVDLSAPRGVPGLCLVPGLVWAFRIHADGSARALAVDQPIELHGDGWLWLHFNLADARASEWLRAAALPAPALAVLLSRDRHQQLHTTEACIYGIFADFIRRIEGTGDDIGHLRFVVIERLLVTCRHHALCSAQVTREAIVQGERRVAHAAALLELIVEHIADAIDRLASELMAELDQIEGSLALGTYGAERPKLARLRRTSARLHRQLSGLRTPFHRLERMGTEGLKQPLRVAASKIAQRLDALDHDIAEMRHRAQLLQEEIAGMTAEAINRNLNVLAIVTALFLPPTFVTGVFGMNTKGLPFADAEEAFLWVAAIMVASAVAVYLLMRRIGVFKR